MCLLPWSERYKCIFNIFCHLQSSWKPVTVFFTECFSLMHCISRQGKAFFFIWVFLHLITQRILLSFDSSSYSFFCFLISFRLSVSCMNLLPTDNDRKISKTISNSNSFMNTGLLQAFHLFYVRHFAYDDVNGESLLCGERRVNTFVIFIFQQANRILIKKLFVTYF